MKEINFCQICLSSVNAPLEPKVKKYISEKMYQWVNLKKTMRELKTSNKSNNNLYAEKGSLICRINERKECCRQG